MAMACACQACWCLRPAPQGEACEDCLRGDHQPAPNITAPNLAAAPRKCRRHTWSKVEPIVCIRCGHPQDPVLVRRGRSARRRGNRDELTVARLLGGEKVGHHGGPEDVRHGMFVIQVKKFATARFPAWMTAELSKLPRTDGRVPVLVIREAPGPGRRGRAIAVVQLDDWKDLHGGAPE